MGITILIRSLIHELGDMVIKSLSDQIIRITSSLITFFEPYPKLFPE